MEYLYGSLDKGGLMKKYKNHFYISLIIAIVFLGSACYQRFQVSGLISFTIIFFIELVIGIALMTGLVFLVVLLIDVLLVKGFMSLVDDYKQGNRRKRKFLIIAGVLVFFKLLGEFLRS